MPSSTLYVRAAGRREWMGCESFAAVKSWITAAARDNIFSCHRDTTHRWLCWNAHCSNDLFYTELHWFTAEVLTTIRLLQHCTSLLYKCEVLVW